MRKLNFPALIIQSVDELKKLERAESNARVRLRITLLRLLKSREAQFLKTAARLIGISPKHAYQLWEWYGERAFEDYLRLNYKAGKSKLSGQQLQHSIKRAADGTGFGSQQEVREFINQEFSVSYTQGGVCLLFQRLKIKAKTVRPENVNADKAAQGEYKKTLPRVD